MIYHNRISLLVMLLLFGCGGSGDGGGIFGSSDEGSSRNFKLPDSFNQYVLSAESRSVDYSTWKSQINANPEEISPFSLFPVDVVSAKQFEYIRGGRYLGGIVLEYRNNSRAASAHQEMLRNVQQAWDIRTPAFPREISSTLNSLNAFGWVDNLRPNVHFPVSRFCVSFELDEQTQDAVVNAARFGEQVYDLNK